MTEPNGKDELLDDLEKAVREIVKRKKSTTADKLSAINAGTRLLAIRHKITGGEDSDKGFFSK